MENKKCSKPPTSYGESGRPIYTFFMVKVYHPFLWNVMFRWWFNVLGLPPWPWMMLKMMLKVLLDKPLRQYKRFWWKSIRAVWFLPECEYYGIIWLCLKMGYPKQCWEKWGKWWQSTEFWSTILSNQPISIQQYQQNTLRNPKKIMFPLKPPFTSRIFRISHYFSIKSSICRGFSGQFPRLRR